MPPPRSNWSDHIIKSRLRHTARLIVEDDVAEIAHYIPVERILFGSDWPHAEGMSEPKEYLENVATFTAAERKLIMRDNARALTFG